MTEEFDYCSICGQECAATGNMEIDPICEECISNNSDETPHTIAGVMIPTLINRDDN